MKALRFLLALACAISGSPLLRGQPSVFTDLGTHTALESFSQSVTLTAANNVQWFKIVLPAASASPASYVDIWFNTPGDITDTVAGVYNNTGARIAYDDDSGPGLMSQFSFGQVSPSRPGIGSGSVFSGQSGSLSAGTYWIAVIRYQTGNSFGLSNWAVTSTYTGPQRTTTLNFNIFPAGSPSNPSGNGTSVPSSGGIGTTFVASVTVTPGSNPASTGLAVSLNAFNVDGGSVTLLDDGVAPDVTAGDNVFTGSVTVGPFATPGSKSLAFTITDEQSRTGNGNLGFGVTPPNDNCANATLISEGTCSWDNSAATTDGPSPTCQATTNKDIWFRYIPTFSGTQTISLCGTNFDTVLSVYNACGGAQLACDDDACDGINPPGSGLASIITNLSITNGTPLLIRVAAYGSQPAGGPGTLTINPPPSNPTGIGTAAPDHGAVGATFVATVAVTAGNYPPSTGLGVSLDAVNVDGGTVVLRDDGVAPDAFAGDKVFSGNVTVGLAATMGPKSLPFTITDSQSRTGIGNMAYWVGPANDECANATPVTNGTYAWDNSYATTDGPSPDCQPLTSLDIWYLYAPPQTGTATISLCGTNFDTVLSVYDLCGGTQLACDDDSCDGVNPPGDTLASSISNLPVNSGSTYLVRIASYGSIATGGAGTMTICEPNTPPSGIGDADPSAAEIGNSFVATVSVTPGTNPDSSGLSVSLDGTLVDGGAVALLDDGNSPDAVAGDNIFTGLVTIGPAAAPGIKSLPYSITDFESRSGEGTISFTVLGPPPANDFCANAEPVTEGSFAFDNSNAMTDGGSPGCQPLTVSDIWFDYVPAHTGHADISTCGTLFDTVVSVLDACAGMELACNDDGCDGVNPPGSTSASLILALPVMRDAHYIIRVASYGSEPTGDTGTLSITLTPDPCPGDTNGDLIVDLSDLAAVLAAYGTSFGDPGYDPAADLDGGGTIDLGDLAELLSLFGVHC